LETGSAREFYRKDTFNNFKIAVPNANLIDIANEVFDRIFKNINNAHSEIKTLTELRESLLPKLLSGEIEIPDESVVV
jgi:type I restriction enzyme, S subunit